MKQSVEVIENKSIKDMKKILEEFIKDGKVVVDVIPIGKVNYIVILQHK